jgi:toxin ParE1/3/4
VATYSLSEMARRDLSKIARFTQQKWGIAQAERYARSIAAAFQLLADRPALGRVTTEARLAKRRFEHESHVIFYREEAGGIRVQRILHKAMLAAKHNI